MMEKRLIRMEAISRGDYKRCRSETEGVGKNVTKSYLVYRMNKERCTVDLAIPWLMLQLEDILIGGMYRCT